MTSVFPFRRWLAIIGFPWSVVMLALVVAGVLHESMWWAVLFAFNIGWTGEYLLGDDA